MREPVFQHSLFGWTLRRSGVSADRDMDWQKRASCLALFSCMFGCANCKVVHYRKTHLWDTAAAVSKSVSRSGDEWIRNLHFWEDYVDGSWASRGDSPGFVETEFGRVGIGTMALMKRVPQTFCKPKVHRCRIRFPMYRKHARLDIRTWKASHHQTHTDTHCKQALRLFLSLPLPLPSESGLSHCMQYEEPQMLSRPWFHIRYLDAGVSVLRLQTVVMSLQASVMTYTAWLSFTRFPGYDAMQVVTSMRVSEHGQRVSLKFCRGAKECKSLGSLVLRGLGWAPN